MSRKITQIVLTSQESSELTRRVNAAKTPYRDRFRAQIVLLYSQGMKQEDVAKQLKTSHVTVSKWTRRFFFQRLAGLQDTPGRGRKPYLPEDVINAVITRSTQPPKGRTCWSTRSMAKEVGISNFAVHKIWKQNKIKPHLIKTFKISTDPHFEGKFWDVIGLYLNPPERALIFCCDEKTQCQALERSQPGLPLGLGGHIRTQTHDYIRHGTTTLFAALNYVEGTLLKRTESQHTHVEWLKFLKQIDQNTPKELDVHLIADNYTTHKHQHVKTWLQKHPRFHMHFTPTSSSWINLVERFFADITNDCIREGSFESVKELEKSIHAYIEERNQNPTPYRWHADGQTLLEKIHRAKMKLNKSNSITGH